MSEEESSLAQDRTQDRTGSCALVYPVPSSKIVISQILSSQSSLAQDRTQDRIGNCALVYPVPSSKIVNSQILS